MPAEFFYLLFKAAAVVLILDYSAAHDLSDRFVRHPSLSLSKSAVLPSLLQPRQSVPPPPPVPTQCAQYCDPVNAILQQGCPIAQCCTNNFQGMFSVCFLCAADAVGNKDYGPTQASMNEMKAACDSQGRPVNQIWLPGQEPPVSTKLNPTTSLRQPTTSALQPPATTSPGPNPTIPAATTPATTSVGPTTPQSSIQGGTSTTSTSTSAESDPAKFVADPSGSHAAAVADPDSSGNGNALPSSSKSSLVGLGSIGFSRTVYFILLTLSLNHLWIL